MMKGLIPAAGAGVRAYPATRFQPKVLLAIAGKPVIVRNIEIMRDQLGVRDITIIVGYFADQIRAALGRGEQLGVKLDYVVCADPKIGLAQGLLPALDRFDAPFVAILGDEIYLDTNHGQMRELDLGSAVAACAVMQTEDKRQIRKNYSVEIADGRIAAVVEKPAAPANNLLGVGTYLLQPRIADWIRKTPPSPRSGRVEFTDALMRAIEGGERVLPGPLAGQYFNINTIEDYNDANYAARDRNFERYRISVIVPAYNEEESLGYVIDDFRPHVDEVLVVVEADHSFRAKDLGKLREYLKDADMVIGTRTTRQMVEQGSNMRGLLRWGNVIVGKIVEVLWWRQEPRFTDVGCTYRAIWKEAWFKIRDRMEGVGPEFSPEMMIEILRARQRVLEIPVSYYPRVGGSSKHSDSYWKISRTALRMLKTIVRKRFLRR